MLSPKTRGVQRLSHNLPRVGWAGWCGAAWIAGVGYSFITADRDQVFLMPPDVREWLPEPHVAWTVLDAVAQLDLSEFEAAYRADGRSRPAYDPAVMVAESTGCRGCGRPKPDWISGPPRRRPRERVRSSV